jgi:hypothetical protein
MKAKPTSNEAKPADDSSATPSSNEPKLDTALNTTGTTPPAPNSPDRAGSAVDRAAPSAPAPAAPVANDTIAKQRPCPKGDANCLEGGAPSPAKELTNPGGTAARLTEPAQPPEPVRQAAGAAQLDRQATRAAQPDRQVTTAAQPDRQATRAAQQDRQATRAAQPARPTAGVAQPRQGAGAQEPERVESRVSNGQEASSSQQQQEAANGQDERAQWSRRAKATTTQRERADQQSGARRNVATVGRSSRAQDDTRASESFWDFGSDASWTSPGRGQNRDEWREREGRRERDGWGGRVVDENVPPARFSGRKEKLDRAANWRQDRPSEDRWEERNVDRTSNRRRDRYDENSRDDRRGRAGREDDFVMGRSERNDGPLMIFPFFR